MPGGIVMNINTKLLSICHSRIIIILLYLYAFIITGYILTTSAVPLPVLNFPPIDARFQQNEAGVLQVFDMVRRKFVVLSPEEWVRQHVIHYLIYHKEVPVSMISVEKQLILNGTRKRTDVVVFSSSLRPLMIIECKAPSVELDQQAVNQILRYNLTLNVPYLFITNGRQHVSLKTDGETPEILKEMPSYPVLTKI